MANDVNCEEKRFVIRNLVYVEDLPRQHRLKLACGRKTILTLSSPTMAPEILLDGSWNYTGISLEREGWCSTSTVGISLSYETKVIEPVGEQATQHKQPLDTDNKSSQPNM